MTKEFVRKAEIDPEAKRDLGDALYTFIKVNQAPTFSAKEFSEGYLPLELQDAYERFMVERKFPNRSVVRDISEMGTRLRRRRFRFGVDIELSVSAEAFRSGEASIKSGPASEFGGEGDQTWTRVTIKRPMTDQL